MAYIRDWSTAEQMYPWDVNYGNILTLDEGLIFGGNKTIIGKEQNTYLAGTTRIHFEDYNDGTVQKGNQIFGVGVWENNSGQYLTAYLAPDISAGDLNFILGFCTVNKFTGAIAYVGDVLYITSEIPGQTGYIDLWHSGGTWYNKVIYDGGNIGSVTFSDTNWNPTVGQPTTVSHFGYMFSGVSHTKITSGTYSVDAATLPIDRYFWYTGYYNNGSDTGTYDLTGAVLSVSPIQQYMYLPGNGGVFSSSVSVVLKNDSDQWADFTGYSTTGESFNPPGVFRISDPLIHSGNEILFAGFLDYNNIQFDALNKTVTLDLNSVISQVLDKPIMPSKYINKARGDDLGYMLGMIAAETVGEITQIITDSDGGGTFVVDSTMNLIAGELLTVNIDDDDDRGAFKVGSVLGSKPTTFTVKKLPTWVVAGDYLVRNRAYPYSNEVLDSLQFYKDVFKFPLALYDKNYKDSWGGNDLKWVVFKNSMSQAMENILISPSKKLFGDEKYIDVLDDFLLAVGGGGFAAYNGNNVNILIPSPTFLLQETDLYLAYDSDVFNSFTSTRGEPIKNIYVEYAYDEESKKYLESVSVDVMDYGIDKKISTWLINYNEDARSLAYFTSAFFSSGAVLNITTTGVSFETLNVGDVVLMSNLPEEFEISGTRFLITNRFYDPTSQLATFTIVEISAFADEYFRVDYHDIGGTVGVL